MFNRLLLILSIAFLSQSWAPPKKWAPVEQWWRSDCITTDENGIVSHLSGKQKSGYYIEPDSAGKKYTVWLYDEIGNKEELTGEAIEPNLKTPLSKEDQDKLIKAYWREKAFSKDVNIKFEKVTVIKNKIGKEKDNLNRTLIAREIQYSELQEENKKLKSEGIWGKTKGPIKFSLSITALVGAGYAIYYIFIKKTSSSRTPTDIREEEFRKKIISNELQRQVNSIEIQENTLRIQRQQLANNLLVKLLTKLLKINPKDNLLLYIAHDSSINLLFFSPC